MTTNSTHHTRRLLLFFAIISIAFLLLAIPVGGVYRDYLLLFGSIFVGIFVDRLLGFQQNNTFVTLKPAVSVLIVCLIASTTFLGIEYVLLWRRTRPMSPIPYPRSDGNIATFSTGIGSPARNELGYQFSIMSDSAWNISSKIWYELAYEAYNDPNCFLRIHYQLANTDREPYVGIFSAITVPPANSFDISHFDALSFRIRLGQLSDNSPITVSFVIYSANIVNELYAYPAHKINSGRLATSWTNFEIPFTEFTAPDFVPYNVQLDLSQVFQIGIVIRGIPLKPSHGSIDVDDIRFSRR